METQVQTLLEASRVAIDSVNAPTRVTEVAEHGVHAGATRAIAVVSTMSGPDYRQWEPVFPEWGAAREEFKELVDDLYFPTDAVVGDVSLDGVIGNLFGDESD